MQKPEGFSFGAEGPFSLGGHGGSAEMRFPAGGCSIKFFLCSFIGITQLPKSCTVMLVNCNSVV